MNTSQGNIENRIRTAEERIEGTLRERVGQARDAIENVRERAEVAFRDKPYLLPVAAGALGLGVGILLGSRLMRFILFTAVGTIVSDTLGGEVKRLAGDFMHDMQNRLQQGREGGGGGEVGEQQPAE